MCYVPMAAAQTMIVTRKDKTPQQYDQRAAAQPVLRAVPTLHCLDGD